MYVSIAPAENSCNGPPTQSKVNLNKVYNSPINIGYASIGFKTMSSILSLKFFLLSFSVLIHLLSDFSNSL